MVVNLQKIFFTESQELINGLRKLEKKVKTIIHLARKYEIPVIFILHTDKDPSDGMVKGGPGWYLHKGLHRTNED